MGSESRMRTYMRELGYADDSPEVQSMNAYEKLTAPQKQEPDIGRAIMIGLGSGAIAGLDRIGGGDHSHAVAAGTGVAQRLYDLNKQVADQNNAYIKSMADPMLKMKFDSIAAKRKQDRVNAILNQGQAPAPQAQTRQIYNNPSPHLPDVLGTFIEGGQVPSRAQGQTQGQMPPSLPQSQEHNQLSKYQIGEADLEQLPYSQQQIMAMSGVDEKQSDNMRQVNDQVMKRNDQRIKLSEVQRAAAQNDPGLAAEIETAKARAKAGVERETAQKTTAREAQGVSATLQSLYDLPDTVKGFDNYIGPIQSSSGPLGMFDYFRSGDSTAVRSDIKSKMQAVTVTMKKFVKEPGDGSWSNEDQAGLERMVGNLMIAPDTKTYRTMIGNINNLISKAFTEPSGTKMPDLQSPGGSQVTPQVRSEIMRRFNSATPEVKAEMAKELAEKGIDVNSLAGAP